MSGQGDKCTTRDGYPVPTLAFSAAFQLVEDFCCAGPCDLPPNITLPDNHTVFPFDTFSDRTRDFFQNQGQITYNNFNCVHCTVT